MSMFESVVVGLVCTATVFLVLTVLFALVSMISKVFGVSIKKKSTGGINNNYESEQGMAVSQAPAANTAAAQAGSLRLNNVDERTAAMIMAIVSHETKTPLNELVFRSISAVD